MAFQFTSSLKAQRPVISAFTDNLSSYPPSIIVNVLRSGTLYWDFHTSATPPARGAGNIAAGSQAVVGGPNSIVVNLSSYGGQTGYLHFRCENANGASNVRTSQQITIPTGWSPLELFASNEKGAFWDFNSTTCYTDYAMETLGSSGQAIRYARDLSGNKNHLIQRDITKSPVLGGSGVAQYVEFDGSNDIMSASFVNLNDGDALTFVAIYRMVTEADRIVFNLTSSPSAALRSGSDSSQKFASADAGTNRSIEVYPVTITTPMLHIGEFDISTPIVRVRVNGVTASNTNSFGSGSNWGTGRNINVGARDAGQFANCRFYAALVLNRALTAGELTAMEGWAQTRGGFTW